MLGQVRPGSTGSLWVSQEQSLSHGLAASVLLKSEAAKQAFLLMIGPEGRQDWRLPCLAQARWALWAWLAARWAPV